MQDAMELREKQELLTLLEQNAAHVRSFGVGRLGLFGSIVRGEQTDTSDVDLLVEFEAGRKSFDSFMSLAFFLEDLLLRPVELVTPESVSPYIRPHIAREVQYVNLIVHKIPILRQTVHRMIIEAVDENQIDADGDELGPVE